jgi:transmembrane sensor
MSGTSLERSPSVRRKARAEAAAWVVQLHGPHRTPELEAALRDWLSADPENQRQFERVTSVWDDARGIPLGGVARVAYWNRSPSAAPWALAAVILLTCCIGALSAYWVYFAHVYRTGIGEQRIVRLDDGSRISLNSDTQLEVRFSKELRRVILSKGEAYFEVTHDPGRPFVVSAGGHDVTAVGTSFMVRFDSDTTAVTLIEGKVTVSNAALQPEHVPPLSGSGEIASHRDKNAPQLATETEQAPTSAHQQRARLEVDGAGSPEVVTLTRGERLVLSRGAAPRLDSPPIDTVVAWRRGEVILDKTLLTDAVADMNRYGVRKLVIDSPDIGKLRISGIYHVGDSAEFAQTIAKLYQLQVTADDSHIRLSRSAAPAAERQR